jgi:Na+/H+-dicarboxylate symporter
VLRRDHHNETVGILICGTRNDRRVRFSLGRSAYFLALFQGTVAAAGDPPNNGPTHRLERIGCDRSVVGLAILTGRSFNLTGTGIYLSS